MKIEELSNRELYSYLTNGNIPETDEDYVMLEDELKSRGLPLPLPVIPAPKTLIIFPLTVPKKNSTIIKIDSKVVDVEHYKDHPFQAIVLAFDKGIEWPALYVGATIYLKLPVGEIFRYNDVSYRYISYSSIVCIK